MEWLYLFIAGFFEISWAVGLKASDGFSHFWISVFTVIGMVASYYFLALAMKNIPLGTAYTVWTGIGAVGAVVFGIILFKEPLTAMRLLCITMIVSGIIGLKFLSV